MAISATLERYLSDQGIDYQVVSHSPTGGSMETAAAAHVSGDRVAKAVVMRDEDGYVMAVLPSTFKLEPAAFFALQVVRAPKRGMVTCHGGGYIASGEIGLDRQPIPHSPRGIKLLDFEGAGEVQTPIILGQGQPKLKLGDPVIVRHAKAGELAEHFRELLLVRNGRIVDRQPTYRGMGKNFL